MGIFVCVAEWDGMHAHPPDTVSCTTMYFTIFDVRTPYCASDARMHPAHTYVCSPHIHATIDIRLSHAPRTHALLHPLRPTPLPPLNPVLVWRASGRPWSLWRAEPPLQAAPLPLPSTPSARAPWASLSRTLLSRIPTRRLEEVHVLVFVHRGTHRESSMFFSCCV